MLSCAESTSYLVKKNINILFIINNIRAGVVTSLLSVLERDPEAPVLDRRSHLPGDGGEGDVHL